MPETIVICPECGTRQRCTEALSPNNRIVCSACGESFSPSRNVCTRQEHIKCDGKKIAAFSTSKTTDNIDRIQVAFKRNGFGSNPIWGYLVLHDKMLTFDLDTGKAALFSAYLMDFGNTDEGIALAATWSANVSEITDVEIGTGILNATLRIVFNDGTCQEFLVANRWKSIGPMRKFREHILRLKGVS